MTREEIRERILTVCGVDRASADFNVGGFHMLCDELERLEREACAKLCESIARDTYGMKNLREYGECAATIRARGTKPNEPLAAQKIENTREAD